LINSTTFIPGAAAYSIQGLNLTDDIYDSTIELLQQRFGRPLQIIAAHNGCTAENTRVWRPSNISQISV